jgi:hypothetical protein
MKFWRSYSSGIGLVARPALAQLRLVGSAEDRRLFKE